MHKLIAIVSEFKQQREKKKKEKNVTKSKSFATSKF